jgi:UDP-N-acetylmuramoylalanine--D-glutamate ligase
LSVYSQLRESLPAVTAPPTHINFGRALVIGMGASGRAAARLLLRLGVQVRAYDRGTPSDVPTGVDGFFGSETIADAAFEGIDVLVLSPGVPPGPALAQQRSLAPAATVHGELSLALSLLHERAQPSWHLPPTVLITGTNGKSTVTALLGALLEAAGHAPFVGGNLGATLCDALADLGDDAPLPTELVLECSSYQLETLPVLPTRVAMVLNVTPDHLDRYRDMQHYAETKARVFDGLDADGLALLDDADPWTEHIAPPHGGLVRVGASDGPGVTGEGEGDVLRLLGDERIERSTLRISGRHNASNAIFSVLAARHLGVDLATCSRVLERFEGLPHRMVFVRELDEVAYYNDSKATNVASALASLGGLDRPFVLIAGGLAKGDDLAPLAALLAARGRGIVAIGDAQAQFLALARAGLASAPADDLPHAVDLARAMARPGDAVVLAPACASWDQFRSYAHRGEVFTDAVRALR